MTQNDYISDLCDALDRLNAPNPLNPAGIFGEPRDYYENYLDNEFERGHK